MTLHYITLLYLTLYYITLARHWHYITLYLILHLHKIFTAFTSQLTLHYITLQYITLHAYVHTYRKADKHTYHHYIYYINFMHYIALHKTLRYVEPFPQVEVASTLGLKIHLAGKC
jgi:hypothetical protein